MEALPLAAAAMMGMPDVSAQVVLNIGGDFEQRVVQYQCEGLDPFQVKFINAEPNYLAIVPIGPQLLVFVSVVSADGVRYVSGQYEFWTKGSTATLTDFTAQPKKSADCDEINDTP